MNKISKGVAITFGSIAALLIIALSSYIIYCWATYIDKTITEGAAYGFNIGETKLESFKKAQGIYQDKDVFILHPLDKNNFGPHQKIAFHNEDYALIEGRDKWTFYFDEGFFNSLKLTFESEKLTRIHRHRKNFELP